MDHDGFSDKSEREIPDDWETPVNENGGRLTEESDMDQSDETPFVPQATAYTRQSTEELAEVSYESLTRIWTFPFDLNLGLFSTLPSCPRLYVLLKAGEASQVETVSEENKGLIWGLLKQLRPGMDLSKVVLPTFILEPRSFLDKLSDYYYHADLLSQSVTCRRCVWCSVYERAWSNTLRLDES